MCAILSQSPAKYELTAEEQLAADWRLFHQVESGAMDYAWRLWDLPAPAVILGRFARPAQEVFADRCERDGVPVVRRFSGGGTVVIGPGCLNVSVVLDLQLHPELVNVARSFDFVLSRIAAALAIEGLQIEGRTDLAIERRKVSGNAQRRGRRALVHHGTLLYDFDPMLATRYLREPCRQPDYRAHRPHHDFIGRLPMPRELLVARLSVALSDPEHFWRR